jgi:hypothetical protein
MATRTRSRKPAAFDRARYEGKVSEFIAAIEDARYRNLAGLTDESNEAAIYHRYSGLFDATTIDAMRARAETADHEQGAHRALLAFATDGYLNARVAGLTDAIATAESRATVSWRGEAIRYRAARPRISVIADRWERNGLFETWLRAVERINPDRIERLDALHAASAELGYADYVEMVRVTRGWHPDVVAANVRSALNDSETGYFAAIRRAMGRIGIEQGDGSLADAWYVLRGSGWDAWFEPRRIVPTLVATMAGLGISLRGQAGATLDLEPRPNKSSRAFCAPVRVPDDVRLVVNPHGGWDDMSAALHEAGHLEHFLQVPSGTPPSLGLLGDDSVTEGYAMLLEGLLGEPAWLAERTGMAEGDQIAFLDFFALFMLSRLRFLGGQLLYELGLHRGGEREHAVHRVMYSGTLGLLAGVRWPEELYLASVDDALYAGTYLRAMALAGTLDEGLSQRHPAGWWTHPDAGATLRELFARGTAWNAEQVVAFLGYDSSDWRPVLRKIRTQLIGEMSGYGGPNITTVAGTRKI